MNAKPHFTLRSSRMLLVLSTMFLMLLQSCDRFEEDALPNDKVAQSDQNDFYILPNSSAIIDLASVINVSEAIEVSIGTDPAHGKLSRLSETLLQYEPSSQFNSGSDHFKIDLFRQGKRLRSDSIHIIVEHDTTQFPCRLFAVEDVAVTAVNTAINIPFLDNDRLCGAGKRSLEKQIFIQPTHGTASIDGNSIVYTPDNGFEGNDSLVYKISVRRDRSYALVKIRVGEDSCRIIANDDAFTFAVTDSTSNTFDFAVTSNDSLCGQDSLESEITVVDAPGHGVLNTVGFGHFQYTPSDSAGQFPPDSFRYRICHGGDCDEAMVTLKFIIIDTCSFQAVNDVVYLDSIPAGAVNIYVLNNDMVCDSLVSLTVTEAPSQGTVYAHESWLTYQPDSFQFVSDSLRYQVCVADSVLHCREASVYIFKH